MNSNSNSLKPDKVGVRRLMPGDEKLLKQVILNTKSKFSSNDFLKNDSNIFLIALFNNDIAGFIYGYRLQRPETNRSKFFIYEIEVFNKHRKKGVGTSLINFFNNIAKEHKGISTFVLTNKSNVGACKLYEKTGAVKTNTDDVLYSYFFD